MSRPAPDPTPAQAAVAPLLEALAKLRASEAVADFLRRAGVPYRNGVDPVAAWLRRELGRDDVRVSPGTYEVVVATEYAGELPPPAVLFLTRLKSGSTVPKAAPARRPA